MEENKATEERRRELRKSVSTGTSIQSLRNGTLPPGTKLETELDEDEYFAYGIAIYIPSLSNATREAAREMDEAQIVQPPKREKSDAEFDAPKGTNKSGEKPEVELKKGPTGVVKQDL